jgi:DNA-binding helix-hairpin-helix protein with protein kinase domain
LVVAAIAAFFLVRNLVDRSDASQGYAVAFQNASSNWSKTEQEWQTRTKSAAFDQKKHNLAAVKEQLSQLPALLKQRMQQLKNDQQRIQLERYLDSFDIEDASIDGIGKGRKQTLASFGVTTAADIDYPKLSTVPGFGPKLTAALVSWSTGLASRFRFDPTRGIDPQDVAKINNDISLLRRSLEHTLVNGLTEIKQIHAQIMNARTQFIEPVRAVYREFLQASANFAAAQGKLS